MKPGDIVVVKRISGECYSRLVMVTKSYMVVDFCGVAVVVYRREDVSPAPTAVQP